MTCLWKIAGWCNFNCTAINVWQIIKPFFLCLIWSFSHRIQRFKAIHSKIAVCTSYWIFSTLRVYFSLNISYCGVKNHYVKAIKSLYSQNFTQRFFSLSSLLWKSWKMINPIWRLAFKLKMLRGLCNFTFSISLIFCAYFFKI